MSKYKLLLITCKLHGRVMPRSLFLPKNLFNRALLAIAAQLSVHVKLVTETLQLSKNSYDRK